MWPFKKSPAVTVNRAVATLDRGDGPGQRRDGWQSALSGVGNIGYDKRMASIFVADPVDPTEAVELWRGNDLAAKIIEGLPDAMVREGFELRVDGDSPNSKDVEKKVTAYWEDLDMVGHLWTALCYERAYGGGAILMGCNDLREMQEPLVIDQVASFDWLHTLEPLELKAIQWQTDPNLKDFGLPTTYMLNPVTIGGSKIMGVHVHASRLVVFPGIRVSRRQITTMAGWGDSTLTRCRGVLRDYNTAWDAAAILVHDFAQAVYKIKGLSEIISLDKDKELVNRIRAMELSRSILRATILDADAEEFSRQQTPLTGLPDLLDRFATRLAAAADMPATLMMGMSPAGLNATGESDIRSWYDRVAASQTRKLRPAIEKIVRVIFSVLDVPEPDSWNVEFNPLWQPTEAEQAAARLTQAQTDKIYVDEAVNSPDEIRQSRFGGPQYSFATQLDTSLSPGYGPHGEPLLPSTGQTAGTGSPSPGAPKGSPPYPPSDEVQGPNGPETPPGPDAEAYRPAPRQRRQVGPAQYISPTNDREDAWSEEAREAAAEARKKGAGEKPSDKPAPKLTREQRATQIAQQASAKAAGSPTPLAHVQAQGAHLRAAAAHRKAGDQISASAHSAQAGHHATEAKAAGAHERAEKHGGEGHGKHEGHEGKHEGHEGHGVEIGEGLHKIGELAEAAYGAVAGEHHDANYNDTIERRGEKWVVLSMEGARLGEYDTEEEAQTRLRQIEYFKKRKKTA